MMSETSWDDGRKRYPCVAACFRGAAAAGVQAEHSARLACMARVLPGDGARKPGPNEHAKDQEQIQCAQRQDQQTQGRMRAVEL